MKTTLSDRAKIYCLAGQYDKLEKLWQRLSRKDKDRLSRQLLEDVIVNLIRCQSSEKQKHLGMINWLLSDKHMTWMAAYLMKDKIDGLYNIFTKTPWRKNEN